MAGLTGGVDHPGLRGESDEFDELRTDHEIELMRSEKKNFVHAEVGDIHLTARFIRIPGRNSRCSVSILPHLDRHR